MTREATETSLRAVVFVLGSQNSSCKSRRYGSAWERRFLEGTQQEGQSISQEGFESMPCVPRAMGSHGRLQTRQSQGLRRIPLEDDLGRRDTVIGMIQVSEGEG